MPPNYIRYLVVATDNKNKLINFKFTATKKEAIAFEVLSRPHDRRVASIWLYKIYKGSATLEGRLD